MADIDNTIQRWLAAGNESTGDPEQDAYFAQDWENQVEIETTYDARDMIATLMTKHTTNIGNLVNESYFLMSDAALATLTEEERITKLAANHLDLQLAQQQVAGLASVMDVGAFRDHTFTDITSTNVETLAGVGLTNAASVGAVDITRISDALSSGVVDRIQNFAQERGMAAALNPMNTLPGFVQDKMLSLDVISGAIPTAGSLATKLLTKSNVLGGLSLGNAKGVVAGAIGSLTTRLTSLSSSSISNSLSSVSSVTSLTSASGISSLLGGSGGIGSMILGKVMSGVGTIGKKLLNKYTSKLGAFQAPVNSIIDRGFSMANTSILGSLGRSFDGPIGGSGIPGMPSLTNFGPGNAGKFIEKPTQYAAKYPFNKAVETPGGHMFEVDDTEGRERFAYRHKSGTMFEMHPDGDMVIKTAGNAQVIVKGNQEVHVVGSKNVFIDGALNVTVGGNVNLQVGGNVDMSVAGSVTAEVSGDLNAQIDGDSTLYTDGDMEVTVGGDFKAEVDGNASLLINGETNIAAMDNVGIYAGAEVGLHASGKMTLESDTLIQLKAPLILQN